MNLENILNQLFDYWINAPLAIAIGMSVLANIATYVFTATLLSLLIKYAVDSRKDSSYIDNRPFKPNQQAKEIRNGLIACLILALCSIPTRYLYQGIWPDSLGALLLQLISFVIFYETYSYFAHRLLHTRYFIKFHAVHHASVRVTPWSAYSVHPVEAVFIGASASLFMCLFSLSLGVALLLHISGMIFTILLHSNYQYGQSNKLLSKIFSYSSYHATHHSVGNANYSFINRFWDYIFKTN